MKKTVLMALVALTITLTPSGALAVPPPPLDGQYNGILAHSDLPTSGASNTKESKSEVKTSIQDTPVIVGAVWDIPFEIGPDFIDTSDCGGIDKTEYNKVVEQVAQALAKGKDIVIAGGSEGTVSDGMFVEIMKRATVINPEHLGSIVRIGGMTMYDTRVALSIYFSSLWKF